MIHERIKSVVKHMVCYDELVLTTKNDFYIELDGETFCLPIEECDIRHSTNSLFIPRWLALEKELL